MNTFTLERPENTDEVIISTDDAIIKIILPALQKELLSISPKISFYPGGGFPLTYAVNLTKISRNKQIDLIKTFIRANGNYKTLIFFGVDVKKYSDGKVTSYELHPEFSNNEKEIIKKVFHEVIFSGLNLY